MKPLPRTNEVFNVDCPQADQAFVSHVSKKSVGSCDRGDGLRRGSHFKASIRKWLWSQICGQE